MPTYTPRLLLLGVALLFVAVMINNDEKGLVLLRIAEVIGQDKLERIDEDTIYFIIRTLNQLNIDQLRNKILLKVLPLKV